MAESTKIQWCHHTFNPWVGCSKVSEGCKNCYAEFLMDHRYGRVQWGPNGTRDRTKTWRDPLKWDRAARQAGEVRKVFCASLADVFEDRRELIPWRRDLFSLIDQCGSLTWLLLTKRPENIRRMWEGPLRRENVWLGTSIATQGNADEAVPILAESADLAEYLFLSIEPQIEFVDLSPFLSPRVLVDWVITGGESQQGGDARPYDINWARDLKDQCATYTVPLFIKQFGSNAFSGRRKLNLRDGHGGDWSEWPEDMRVRECPESYFPQLIAAMD